MITHLVVVELRYPRGSAEEAAFLADCGRLAAVPGVQDFEVFHQVKAGTRWQVAFSMRFVDQQALDAYQAHPDHVAFTEEIWAPHVVAGEDIDLVSA